MSRRPKKKIDYSMFCDELEDYSGSDDDFQDSPTLPPAKRTRTKEKTEQKRKTDTNKKSNKKATVEAKTEINNVITKSGRLNRDEKLYQRDIQAALEMSKKSSRSVDQDNAIIEITDDVDVQVTDQQVNGTDAKNVKQVEVINDMDDRDGEIAIGDSKESKNNDSDFDPTGVADSDDDDVADDIADDIVCSEDSDDDYEAPKKKSNITNAKRSFEQAVSKSSKSGSLANSFESSKGISGKSEIVSSTSSSFKDTSGIILPTKLGSSGAPRVGLNASSVSMNSLNSPNLSSIGNSAAHRTMNIGLPRHSPGSGLGGVNIKNSGPSGIRLGLSRNVRVAKPLHPNAMIKNG